MTRPKPFDRYDAACHNAGMNIVRSLCVVMALLCPTLKLAAAQGFIIPIQLAHMEVTQVEGVTEFIKGQPGGFDFIQFSPEKIGDSITFSVPIRGRGRFAIQTTSYKDGAEGIYSLTVNGVNTGKKDFYLDNRWYMGDFDVTPGVYVLTYRCVGKNPKSKGIGIKLSTLEFDTPRK